MDVTNINEYANKIVEGQNRFLEDGELTQKIIEQTEDEIVISPEQNSNIIEENVYSYTFKDSNGEFKFTVINETYFKIHIITEPNWHEIDIDDHVGESIGSIIASGQN